MYPMNDELRDAANLMAAAEYFEAAQRYKAIHSAQPDHAAMAASQVGAALFFLRDFKSAILWYQEAGRLGFDAQMIAGNIAEAQQAINAPYVPAVGDVVLTDEGVLFEYRAEGWKQRT